MKKHLKNLRSFTLDTAEVLICPTCKCKTLELQPDSIFETELSQSKAHSQLDDFELEWSSFIYNAQYKCLNTKCKEIVLSTGTSEYSMEPQFDWRGEYEGTYPEKYYTPKIYMPELNLFEIPEKTPREVTKLIKQAFAIFFQSYSAAMNKMRMALEELLTQHQVDKYPEVVNKNTKPLSLHDRIVAAAKKNEKFKALEDYLYAIKVLGNAGSHDEDEIDFNDVADIFELVKVLLNELYSPKSDLLEKAKFIREKHSSLSNHKRELSSK